MADFGCSDLDKDPLTYALTQVPTDNTFEVDNVSNQLRVKGDLYVSILFTTVFKILDERLL